MKALALALLVACQYGTFDASERIDIVPTGEWDPSEVIALGNAAACWNQAFGTQLHVTDEATADQRVEAVFSDALCIGPSAGRYIAAFTGQIQYCRHLPTDLFWISTHELGHVLGIHAEGMGEESVMGQRSITMTPGRMFTPEDIELLAEVQPQMKVIDEQWVALRGDSVVATSTATVDMDVGDVDGDGTADLVTVDLEGNLVLYRSLQQPAVETSTVQFNPRVTLADLDADGDLDAIVGSLDGKTMIHGNDGHGAFSASPSFNACRRPCDLVDLDGDGTLDLVGDRVVLVRGTDVAPIALPSGRFTAGDFDADGAIDLATATLGAYELTIYRNRGDATFEPRTVATAFPVQNLIARDFDRDGSVDLLSAYIDSGVGDAGLDVMLARGDSFAHVHLDAGDYPHLELIADITHDGVLDLVLAGPRVFAGRSDGTFEPARDLGRGMPLLATDLDADGRLDLVLRLGTELEVRFGSGARSRYVVGLSISQVRAHDTDGDGDVDLVVRGWNTGLIGVLENRGDHFAGPAATCASP